MFVMKEKTWNIEGRKVEKCYVTFKRGHAFWDLSGRRIQIAQDPFLVLQPKVSMLPFKKVFPISTPYYLWENPPISCWLTTGFPLNSQHGNGSRFQGLSIFLQLKALVLETSSLVVCLWKKKFESNPPQVVAIAIPKQIELCSWQMDPPELILSSWKTCTKQGHQQFCTVAGHHLANLTKCVSSPMPDITINIIVTIMNNKLLVEE